MLAQFEILTRPCIAPWPHNRPRLEKYLLLVGHLWNSKGFPNTKATTSKLDGKCCEWHRTKTRWNCSSSNSSSTCSSSSVVPCSNCPSTCLVRSGHAQTRSRSPWPSTDPRCAFAYSSTAEIVDWRRPSERNDDDSNNNSNNNNNESNETTQTAATGFLRPLS